MKLGPLWLGADTIKKPAEKPRSREPYTPALSPRIRSVVARRTNRLLLSLPSKCTGWNPFATPKCYKKWKRKRVSATPWGLTRWSDNQNLTLTSRFHVLTAYSHQQLSAGSGSAGLTSYTKHAVQLHFIQCPFPNQIQFGLEKLHPKIGYNFPNQI